MTPPRILIIADGSAVVQGLRQALMELGYEPLAGPALGEEAVSLAERLQPDLVLMATYLQGEMDSVAAAQILYDRFDVPVVFLSAPAGAEMADRVRKSASFGFLLEPFDARDLRSAVETALYRHRAETMLRHSREEQAAILRTTLDGFWLVDTQGRILEVNEACCRMLGYERDELLGKSIADIEADETASEIAASIEQIQQAGSAQIERRHRCKDGHLIDVAMSISHLPGGSGRFSVFTRDVTDLKRDEALLGGQKQVLEMIATGGALASTLDYLFRVIEAQSPEMLCSILLLDADGVHLRHGAAPSLPRRIPPGRRWRRHRSSCRILRHRGLQAPGGRRRGDRDRPAVGGLSRAGAAPRVARLLVDTDLRRARQGTGHFRHVLQAARPTHRAT